MKQSVGRAAAPRLVIDTNVFVSALLFDGVASRLVPLWQENKFIYLLSRPVLEEYLQVLAYPKFDLTEREIKALIEEELLPYVETISELSFQEIPALKDSSDRKFLASARSGRANYLITGDKELLRLKRFHQTIIVSPGEYLRQIEGGVWS